MRDTILAWSNYDYFLVSKANFAFCCQFQDSCMARPSFYQRNHLNEAVSKNMKTSGNPKRWVGSPWNGSAGQDCDLKLEYLAGWVDTTGRAKAFVLSSRASAAAPGLFAKLWPRMPGGSGKEDTGPANNLGKLFRWKILKNYFLFYSMESSRESHFNPI